MSRLEIDAETFDALFDSGEVDMEPYLVPGTGYRPYLEDPPPAAVAFEGEYALPHFLWPYRGENARWLKPGPIRDLAEDVASDRRASEIQRQLATTLLNRIGVVPRRRDLAQKVLCHPHRYAAKTRELAELVMEHAKTTFNPDFEASFTTHLVSD